MSCETDWYTCPGRCPAECHDNLDAAGTCDVENITCPNIMCEQTCQWLGYYMDTKRMDRAAYCKPMLLESPGACGQPSFATACPLSCGAPPAARWETPTWATPCTPLPTCARTFYESGVTYRNRCTPDGRCLDTDGVDWPCSCPNEHYGGIEPLANCPNQPIVVRLRMMDSVVGPIRLVPTGTNCMYVVAENNNN